ncbi:hypothetical protein [Saccharicrinis sp. 156]|uniref:hypothetical protein n=1 Tax=Saccharicrinis sp. 156 TaxID=3417574 RepID=UPI003D336E7B
MSVSEYIERKEQQGSILYIKRKDIECISIHYKNGESKLFCTDELDKISIPLLSDILFLFAVINHTRKRAPIMVHNHLELLCFLAK